MVYLLSKVYANTSRMSSYSTSHAIDVQPLRVQVVRSARQ